MRTFALNRIKDVLWVLAISALVVGVLRMVTGLGPASYMSDGIPWGLWKIFNMVAGAALATGGFIVACIIYIFQLEKYRPLARVAILIGFLGYGSSLTALLFDIGLPHRFWHPFFMWNPHSFLFEVFWCVSCYFGVCCFEMLPVVFERLPWPRLTHILHEIAVPIVMVGITLSTMHHSSLGSLFMVSPTRLHPLWYTTWIPIEFFTSAMGAGMAVIVFVTIVYSFLYNKKLNMPVLTGMAKASAVTLLVYLGLRIADFSAHTKWRYVFGPDITWETWVFLVEIALQVFIPVFIFSIPRLRNYVPTLFLGTLSAALGLSMHRIDVGIIGYFTTAGTTYFPSLGEILLSLGILSAATLLFFFLVENYFVFEPPEECTAPDPETGHVDRTKPWTIDELLGIVISPEALRYAIIIMVTIPVVALAYMDRASTYKVDPQPISAPRALNEERTDLLIDGNRMDYAVAFQHEAHKDLVNGEDPCMTCHHLALPNDHASACFRCHKDMNVETDIFDHENHQEYLGGRESCSRCHDLNLPKGIENAKSCGECHTEENMPGMNKYVIGEFNRMAPGYKKAMHGICLTCHRRYGREMDCMDQPDCIGNCKACHPD